VLKHKDGKRQNIKPTQDATKGILDVT